jgi:hypothetical protein
MSEPLKTCPFCGVHASVRGGNGNFFVYCLVDSCPGTASFLTYSTEEDAATAWNYRRFDAAASLDAAKAVRDAIFSWLHGAGKPDTAQQLADCFPDDAALARIVGGEET